MAGLRFALLAMTEHCQRMADQVRHDMIFRKLQRNRHQYIFNAQATQSGYINTQNNTNTFDLEILRKIIQEKISKKSRKNKIINKLLK